MTMMQPDLKYCPKCRDEYYPQIERCASCNVSLVLGTELSSHKKKKQLLPLSEILSGEADLVPIHKAALVEIRRLENVLKKEHINVIVTSEEKEGCGKGCGKSCGGSSEFYLQVRREDASEAFRVLEADYFKNTGLDAEEGASYYDAIYNPEAGEATCPACGEQFSTVSNICPGCGLCF